EIVAENTNATSVLYTPRVVLLVEFLVFPAFYVRYPILPLLIPPDRSRQAFAKIHLRTPSCFACQLLIGKSISPVMSWPVGHSRNQALRLSGLFQNPLHHVQIRKRTVSPHVI